MASIVCDVIYFFLRKKLFFFFSLDVCSWSFPTSPFLIFLSLIGFDQYDQVADASEDIESYLDYAQGYNLSHRLPMFVKVDSSKLLTVNATMWLMRNHFETTWLVSAAFFV